jgi:predicted transcriptional regulator
MINNPIQSKIIYQLSTYPKLKYSEIRNKINTTPDLFKYHLKVLIERGYVTKDDKRYQLTQKGKVVASFQLGENSYQKQLKNGCFVWVVKPEGKRVLCCERKSSPHRGYKGELTFKIEKGRLIEELIEEKTLLHTGLLVKEPIYIGTLRKIFINDDETILDGIFLVYVVLNFEGKLLKESRKFLNSWLSYEEFLKSSLIFKEEIEMQFSHIDKLINNRVNYQPFFYQIIENEALI